MSGEAVSLIVFDIDGTLTETMSVDSLCFLQAFRDVFGFHDIDSDWSVYRHTTDSGILNEICVNRTGRAPTDSEVRAFRDHFIALLSDAAGQEPFQPVRGAVAT